MRSRKIIEDSFKDLIIQSGNEHIRVELELFLDIRELLDALVASDRSRKQLEDVRQARMRRELERNAVRALKEDEGNYEENK